MSKVQIEDHKMVLLNTVTEGACPICAVKHEPDQPHNRDSLFYQYKFYFEHERWPTWEDAMSHCPIQIREIWIRELQAHGVKVGNTHVPDTSGS